MCAAFLGYMFGHPGKKLLFMGCDIGQTSEWNYNVSLPWHLLHWPVHYTLQTMVKEINWLYRREPALYEVDDAYAGFEWIDFRDAEACVISFFRFAKDRSRFSGVRCNFTPVPRHGYRIGVPSAGEYHEIFNTDSAMFGGSNMGNGGSVIAEPIASHGRPASVRIVLPPLAMVVFKPARYPRARFRLKAALISPRWVRACGKFPIAWPCKPVCSAYRPR